MPAIPSSRCTQRHLALVIAGLTAGVSAARAQEAETRRAAPGLPGRVLFAGTPVVGLDARAEYVIGHPKTESDLGQAVRLHAGLDLPGLPRVRCELGVGLSRQINGRRAIAETTYWRVPLVLSLVGRTDVADPSGAAQDSSPTPYVRLGAGLVLGREAWDGVAGITDASPSFTWQWGGGVELPVGLLFGTNRVLARLDLTYGIEYERPGERNVVMLGLGVAFRHPADEDDDGLLDVDDACPAEPEDRDDFEDRDGCPDADNDADGLLDDDDACPDVAEDLDGFRDADGCPDADNDEDGVVDGGDLCPNEPEDADNWDDADGCPDADNDEDGIPDRRDVCPDEPEEIDGYADADGCPDPDNDGDLIADVDDACPFRPEDFNGFRDEDGCPDAPDDRDGDGLVNLVDLCPAVPEDMDGFDDQDGCPELDNDGDGVPDAGDACPMAAEDADGFEDADGCPDLDNDGDGIRDGADRCPGQAEVINGHEDEDGCPDEGVQLVRLLRDKIEIREAIQFDTDSEAILERSFELMNQIAALLKNHAELKKVRIEGHTDSRASGARGLDLSQRRADSVARYLVEAGVEPERLVAVGYGETRPIASNKSRAGREMNRRIEIIVAGLEGYFEAPAEPEATPGPPGGAAGDAEDVPEGMDGDGG